MESTSLTDVGILTQVIFAAALLALPTTLAVGGAIGYRKSRDTVARNLAAVAVAGGVAMLTTLVLGRSELIPGAAVWPLLFLELGLLGMLLWVSMLVDCAVNEPDTGNDKLVWVIIVLFTHIVGAALYLFVRRPRRLDEMGR